MFISDSANIDFITNQTCKLFIALNISKLSLYSMQLSSKNLNWKLWCCEYTPQHTRWVIPLFPDFLCVCSYCLVLETPQKPWAHIVICMKPCCFECLVTISTFFPNMFSAVKITWRFLHFTQLCAVFVVVVFWFWHKKSWMKFFFLKTIKWLVYWQS